MPYTVEDYKKDLKREILESSSPEERLNGLSPEDLLRGLSRTQIEAYLEKLRRQGRESEK